MPAVTFYNSYSDMSDYRDGYEESYRRATDELNRYKLTDVQEADEYEEDYSFRSFYSTHRNRYSSFGSTGSSMDALWESYPRRLSEAGLSRYSDNSTILTEDTDSFIIGQHVWVGGSKPGQIAFIGETQFAPGEWAGIVLDQPIGKNDGSVAGHRYFQCEAKRGVFSRLTRLTRSPLPGADLMGSGDTFSVSSTDAVRARKLTELRRSPPATQNGKSALRSATPLSTSNSSLHSAGPELKLGDRVIVSSSQGSKVGTLRYIGFTAFANGEWCGVELDNPVGKNDGSVQGKRYFECLPCYGVFAPLTKVSRSPSKTKPGNCAIHSSPGIRRANSRESLASMTSSIVSSASGMRRVRLGVNSLTPVKKSSSTPPKSASTPIPTRMALQDVLKEKQKHIEQLLKERDLEREAITRAASQADNAEQKLVVITKELATQKQQFENYRSECDLKLKEHLELLSKLKLDRQDLLTQLDDEKRKNEDVLFKFEEAAITKTDVEATNDSYLVKIKELESQLSSERKRLEDVESESLKDASMLKQDLHDAREQTETLKSELEAALTKNSLLSTAEVSTYGHLEDLKAQLEESKLSYDKTKADHDKVVDELNNKLSRSSSELELAKFTLNKDIEDLKTKLEADSANKTEAINTLKTELVVSNKSLEDKVKEYELLKLESTTIESAQNKEIDRLKIEISAKVFDIENGNDVSEKYKNDLVELQKDHDRLKEELQATKVNNEKDITIIKDHQLAITAELENTKKSLLDQSNEIETYAKKIQTTEDTVKLLENDKVTLQKIIDQTTVGGQQLQNTILELQADIQKADTEINAKAENILQLTMEISDLRTNVTDRESQYNSVAKDLKTLQTRFEECMSELAKANEIVNSGQLEYGDLERKYNAESEKLLTISEQKTKLEADIQNLLASSGDNSAKLEEFMTDTREKQKLLETMKDDFNKKQQESQHAYQELQITLESMKKDNDKMKLEYEENIKSLLESERGINEKLLNSKKDATDQVQALTVQITDLQNNLSLAENKCIDSLNTTTKTEADLRAKHEQQHLELTTEISKLQEIEMSLKSKLEEESLSSIKLQEGFNADIIKLQSELSDKTKALDDVNISNSKLNEHIQQLTQSLSLSDNELKRILEEQATKEETIKSKDTQNEDQLKKYTEVEHSLKSKLEELQLQSNATAEEYEKNVEELKNNLANRISELEKLENDSRSKEADLTTQLEVINKERVAQIEEFQTKINLFNTEIQQHKEVIERKSQEIADISNKNTNDNNNWEQKEQQIKSELEEKLQTNETKYNESQSQIKSLQQELDCVKKDCNSNIVNASAKDKEVSSLTVRVNELNQAFERIQKEKEEMMQLAITEGKQSEQNYTSQITELSTKLGVLENKVSQTENLQKEFEIQRNNYAQVVDLLHITEKQKQTLVKQLEDTVNAKAQSANCSDLISIVKKIQVNNTDVGKIMELQMHVEQKDKAIEDVRRSIKVRDTEIDDLKKKLSQALSENLSRATPEPLDDNVKTVSNGKSNNYKQLLEEKLFAESQVQFLNSIIVDMKKKTDEQQARIEILECGYGVDVADEIALMGAVDRRVAPRKYCDICEEFDLHETEDCPIQDAAAMPPPPPPTEGGKKKKPEPRSYCDNCEMFGHETQNCPEDETF